MDPVVRLTAWHAGGGAWGHMDGWGMGGWMWLWGLLLLIGIVLLVVVAVLALTRGTGGSGGRQGRAKEILDERYARGEIDTEEYHERLRELS